MLKESMRIVAKTLDGKQVEVDVDLRDTIATVMAKIMAMDPGLKTVRLIFGGSVLDNSSTVAECKLAHGDEIWVVVNTSDEAAKPQMVTLNSSIFDALDTVQELTKGLNLPNPTVVVIGNENVGKSTLLESLIGFPVLPRKDGHCTKILIRVFLRRGPQQQATVGLWKRKTATAPATPDEQPTPCALEAMCALVQQKMDAAVADAKKPIVTDKELRICIQLPHCPWLNLVDLPGLVIAHANPELPQLTQALAQSVVAEEKNHGIFLLVVEATAQASQSLATKLLQQAQVLDRTLGVFTKCDRVSADEQNRLSKGMIIEKLLNETAPGSIHLPNGWSCCSIVIAEEMQAVPPIDGCRETMRLQLGRVKEHQFMEPLNLSCGAAKRSGMPRVVQLVQTFYEKYIVERWIPAIWAAMTAHFNDAAMDQFQLGVLMPNMAAYRPLVAELGDVAPGVLGSFDATVFDALIATQSSDEHKAVVVVRVNTLVADPQQDVFKMAQRRAIFDSIELIKDIVAAATQTWATARPVQDTVASVAAVTEQLRTTAEGLVADLGATCQPDAGSWAGRARGADGLVNLLLTEVFKPAPVPPPALLSRLTKNVVELVRGSNNNGQASLAQLHSKPGLKAGLAKHLMKEIAPRQR